MRPVHLLERSAAHSAGWRHPCPHLHRDCPHLRLGVPACPMPTFAPGLGARPCPHLHRDWGTMGRKRGAAVWATPGMRCSKQLGGHWRSIRVCGSEFKSAYAGACSAERRLAQRADGGWRYEPLHPTTHSAARNATHTARPCAPCTMQSSRTHARCLDAKSRRRADLCAWCVTGNMSRRRTGA